MKVTATVSERWVGGVMWFYILINNQVWFECADLLNMATVSNMRSIRRSALIKWAGRAYWRVHHRPALTLSHVTRWTCCYCAIYGTANNSPVMDYDMVQFELSSHCRTLTQRHISSKLRPKVHCMCVCVEEEASDRFRWSIQVKLWAEFARVGCWIIHVSFKSHHRAKYTLLRYFSIQNYVSWAQKSA